MSGAAAAMAVGSVSMRMAARTVMAETAEAAGRRVSASMSMSMRPSMARIAVALAGDGAVAGSAKGNTNAIGMCVGGVRVANRGLRTNDY